jgi:hypothetical protein
MEARVTSRQRLVALEEAVRGGAARVHDALGDALVVDMGDLLAEDEILEQRRSAQPSLQRILVVRDRERPGSSSGAGRRNRRGTRSSESIVALRPRAARPIPPWPIR